MCIRRKARSAIWNARWKQKDVSGHIGIAHTRWATHGEPCAEKRPSHYSASGNLALIHNGIIENYATLKERLQQRGVKFRSQTESEVLVQLIEYIQVSNDLVVGCRASGLA